MKARWHELLALFLAACASLLYEITLTKIFEFSVWSNYAYLVISTAMFGLGLAGVVLMRFPGLLAVPRNRFLARNSLGMAGCMLVGFLVMNYVPIHLPDAPLGWGRELVNLGVVFCAISLPFFCFGLVMSYIFENDGETANVYYFADLLGAGVGSFLIVFLIPVLQPQGLVVLCSFLGLAAAALFSLRREAGRRAVVPVAVALAIIAAAGFVLVPRAARKIPLNVHAEKRGFKWDLLKGRIEATRWSALSRVDVAAFTKNLKRVWIAGGVNESNIKQFNGDFKGLRPKRDFTLANAAQYLNYYVLPHLSKIDHTVCVIGTSGGIDSMLALECGARKVTGVEMDPSIADLVTGPYRKWAGGLFTDGDYSELVVDEGRSYLRRSGRKFDVIMQINNATPIAFAKGALNLSENYLLTVESLGEFYDHLTDDGIIYISRSNIIRLLTTSVEMLRRKGMKPEEYAGHLIVCRGPRPENAAIMIKRSAFTPEEVDKVFAFYQVRKATNLIFYAPYRTGDLPDLSRNIYYKVATSPDPRPYWRVGPFDFSPPTDQKPFFNHILSLGMRDDHRREFPLLPAETRDLTPPNALHRRVPKGDMPVVLVLFEAVILATIFFGLPLVASGDLRHTLTRNLRSLGYFAALGIAFIFIEICLIQRLLLFLGAPVYSLAVVFGSLLLFAGLGSLVSGRLKPEWRTLRLLLFIVAGVIVAMHFIIPLLTQAFLGAVFPVRILVSILVTGTLGFVMGMPMPTGIRYLKATGTNIISWAWAINGYFTVIGSALSVILAVNFGFLTVFFLAAGIYAAAPYFLRR